jgi:hypothetical protein
VLVGIGVCAGWVFVSSVQAAPHSLAYFNEIGGGLRGGHAHLLHSNIDWGQDLLALDAWRQGVAGKTPVFLAYYGYFDPIDFGVDVQVAPFGPIKNHDAEFTHFVPGYYAISVNYIYGCEWGISNPNAYEVFRTLSPVARCGGSIYVFHLDEALIRKFAAASQRVNRPFAPDGGDRHQRERKTDLRLRPFNQPESSLRVGLEVEYEVLGGNAVVGGARFALEQVAALPAEQGIIAGTAI